MRRVSGFTLIEMLLVVGLLAATASVALAVLGNREHQMRHDDSERRLDEIVRAVVGEVAPVWGHEVRLSGFVVDNGRLPVALRELSARDALIDATECTGGGGTAVGLLNCHKLRAALFDPTPSAADGFSNSSGDEISLSGAAEALPKGLRRHLEGRDGSSTVRDGWANVSLVDDATNFGWQLTVPVAATDPWTVLSLGSNNALDAVPPVPDTDLAADLARSVQPDDWSSDIAGWTVRVVNASGSAQPATGSLGVSLLVWRNDTGGGRWKRYTTVLDNTPITAGSSRDFVFPAGGYPGGALTTRVPIGEHLLLMVASADGVAHNADDAPFTLSGARVAATARFYPHASRPVIEMVLR